MERKPVEKWISQGKKNCKSYLFYQDKVLDLTDFILQHPGGLKAIKNYVYKDVTNILFEVYHHQRAPTLSKLMKYQVGLIPENESTNARHKLEKSPNTDRPKEKKKVCFFQQNQKSQPHQNSNLSNEEGMKKNMKKSMKKNTAKHKQNIRESTHKSKTAENSSRSKSKQKQCVTSIQVINTEDREIYDDYFHQNKQKVRQKQRANTEKRKQKKQRQKIGKYSFENNELDEEKPNFRVPILFVKSMNRNG